MRMHDVGLVEEGLFLLSNVYDTGVFGMDGSNFGAFHTSST